jgi:hypothetical protein
MDGKTLTLVIVVALLAGIVGGVVGTALSQGSMRMMMGMSGGAMMMSPQGMLETMRLAMLDPTLRRGMLEMHREMHDMMERR